MKAGLAIFCATLAFTIATTAALAESSKESESNRTARDPMMESPRYDPNHLTLNGRLFFNITADFKNIRRRADPGPATGGGINRNYDDGYNRVDGSGNQGGLTWNWGYDSATQIQGDGTPAGVVLMNSSTASATGSSRDVEDDPHYGAELIYGRDLGRLGNGFWGIEAGVGYADVSIRDGKSLSGNVNRITDTYALGGIFAPLPPYMGTFEGPGPVISDSPTRQTTVVPGGATTTGQRKFDADVFTFRLGPYYSFPIWKRLAGSVGVGLAVLAVNGDYRFSEATTIAEVGTRRSSGKDSDDDVLVGGYAGAGLRLAFTESWSLFAGAQYQNVGNFTQRAGSKEVRVDFGKSIVVSAGVGFSF